MVRAGGVGHERGQVRGRGAGLGRGRVDARCTGGGCRVCNAAILLFKVTEGMLFKVTEGMLLSCSSNSRVRGRVAAGCLLWKPRERTRPAWPGPLAAGEQGAPQGGRMQQVLPIRGRPRSAFKRRHKHGPRKHGACWRQHVHTWEEPHRVRLIDT